jgi:8-oxo-dGTP pyrophosphatase MutT (NUDIX family)
MAGKKILFEKSAGGVVYKKEGGKIYIALVAVKDGSVWTFPKGLIDKNEDPKICALREVKEEAGVNATIVDEIAKQEYWYVLEGIKRKKTVYYYLMEYVSGDVKDHDWEVKDAKWISLEDAEGMLKYKGDKQIIQKVKERLS